MVTVLLSAAIAVLSFLTAVGLLPGNQALLWALRCALTFALVRTCGELIGKRSPVAVIGPLPLLAAISGIAFSVVPAIYTTVELLVDGNVRYERSLWFIGSRAELLVIQFSALALLSSWWTSRVIERLPPPDDRIKIDRFIIIPLFAAGLALSALYLATYRGAAFHDFSTSRVWRDVLDATLPVLSLLTAAAAISLAQQFSLGRVVSLGLAVTMMAATLHLGRHHHKMTVYAAIVALGYVGFRHHNLRHWRLTIMLFGAAVVILVSLTAIGNWQRITAHLPLQEVLLVAVAYKFIFRQTDTGACLEGVLRQHFDDPLTGNVVSLIVGLIPGYFWPDKPSLSTGLTAAIRYCGYPAETMYTLNAGHSASVTLLGDPLVYGGLAGYALAVIFLLVLLAGFTIFCVRFGTVGILALAAITPWLIDFDQHYPMYLALSVKNLIYMLPFLYLIKRTETARTS